ncbi:MAG: hypothetical protein D6731_22075 [Planctomycetota bacterium]|nr:MAG: hypothetical protein D6731_22075 [Planctomycetota bacterium]
MNEQHEFTLHPFEEREFRDRFFPALYGNGGEGVEEIVRELLDAADAAGPSWTALHKLFDETRTAFKQAVETEDGGAAARTAFSAFPRFLAHLRPFFSVKGFGLTSIDRRAFPELTRFIRSAGELLLDADGRPLAGIGPLLPTRVPPRCLPGRSGGGVVFKEDVRPMLDRLRQDLPRLAEWARSHGLPAEEGVTTLLAALVHAKVEGTGLFEASDVLIEDSHFDKGHRLRFDPQGAVSPSFSRYFPFAVRAEAARAFGRELAPPEPEPQPVSEPVAPVPYTPQGTYEVGQRLHHKAFGDGEVVAILDSRRLKVQFAEEEKTLVQGLSLGRAADSSPPG